MDGFGDNFTGNDVEVDPAAEFLAREQDQLAGLEDDIPAVAVSNSAPVLSNIEGYHFFYLKIQNFSQPSQQILKF